MKRIRSSIQTILAWMLLIALAAADDRKEELAPEHRKWLEQEVNYIILEREKEIFLALETLEERERFIEAFWRKRDPHPTTPQNEFRDEHYRRLDYANEVLGRSSTRPGWMSDRGRIYIILGEPASVERFHGYNEIVSSELWFYEGTAEGGLPPFFYLLFFRPYNVGDFQLYSPLNHGPTSLLSPQYVPAVEGDRALEILQRVSPELRRASLSLDPAEPAGLDGQAALGADVLLARIEDAPKRMMRADYAEAWLRYGERVEAEYSFNFVPNRSSFVVLGGPEGIPFVHYTVELDPRDFAVETDEGRTKYYTTLDVELEVSDATGHPVSRWEDQAYLEFTPSEMERILTSPFAYQGDFPLVPGEYRVSVIIKNRVLKRFTVAERELVVESFSTALPGLSDLAIGYRAEPAEASGDADEVRTFRVGGVALQPAADHLFVLGETVHAMAEIYGARADHEVRFRLRDETRTLEERSVKVGGDREGAVLERFPLRGMVGGTYVLEADLVDAAGNVLDSESASIQISPLSEMRRPWTYRRSFASGQRGNLALALGRQHLALRQFDRARAELEKAAAEPELPAARWLLAGLLIQSGEDERALALLKPLESDWPRQFEVVAGLGTVYYLRGEWHRAVEYLERAVSIRPPDTAVLNALGDSYLRIGEREKARAAFERSLGLNPDQEEIKDRLNAVGEEPRSPARHPR